MWLDNGHEVHYVQNITDVDDPLFERANRDGIDWRDLAAREIQLFREDMAALRVLPPRDYVAATDAIAEVVELVEKLLASGAAYVVDDPEFPDVYYRADATPQFGYESGYDRDTMMRLFAERGGDPDRPGKTDPLDALLWRAARPDEPSWPSPFGPGRPGWHVECSAISLDRLGFGFDVQGGGSDLIFPHHEFSAAHAECATGERRFARHYVHAGMIGWDGHKMSKSRGNLVLVSRLREQGLDPAVIRLGLFAGHYRSDRFWSDEVLDEAGAGCTDGAAPPPCLPGRTQETSSAGCANTWPTTWTPPGRWPPSTGGARTRWSTADTTRPRRPRWRRPSTHCWACRCRNPVRLAAMNSVNDKVVFISGGARGVGADVARRLRRKNAKLVLTDIDAAPLAELAAELGEDHVLTAVADVRDLSAMQAVADRGSSASVASTW